MAHDHSTTAEQHLTHPNSATPGDDGLVVVAENGVGPYGQRVTTGRHVLVADEPEPAGTDSGPDPYRLLLSALGACTSMTVRMYAERKGWPLEHVTVSLRHERVPAADRTEGGPGDHITREIRLVGDLSAEQRQRLIGIAEKCPVHRTLTSPTRITTTSAPEHHHDGPRT
ncbi:OsmC family protein [Streptomyces sp. PmtG]